MDSPWSFDPGIDRTDDSADQDRIVCWLEKANAPPALSFNCRPYPEILSTYLLGALGSTLLAQRF
jgi:hypothetical protein